MGFFLMRGQIQLKPFLNVCLLVAPTLQSYFFKVLWAIPLYRNALTVDVKTMNGELEMTR